MITDPKYAKKVFEIIKKNVDKVDVDYYFDRVARVHLYVGDDIFIETTDIHRLYFNDVEVDCSKLFVKEIVKYVKDYREEKAKKDSKIRELQAISILESYEV